MLDKSHLSLWQSAQQGSELDVHMQEANRSWRQLADESYQHAQERESWSSLHAGQAGQAINYGAWAVRWHELTAFCTSQVRPPCACSLLKGTSLVGCLLSNALSCASQVMSLTPKAQTYNQAKPDSASALAPGINGNEFVDEMHHQALCLQLKQTSWSLHMDRCTKKTHRISRTNIHYLTNNDLTCWAFRLV